MTITRRNFMKAAAAAGLAIGAPVIVPPSAAWAQASRHGGPYWVTIHAGGGWDPTLLADPKGADGENDPDPVNHFRRDDIQQVGPFNVAPLEGNREFFERWQNEILVINGVDAQTNSHDTGTRFIWSGSMSPDSPTLSAVVATASGATPPLAFLSNGGYDSTADLVPRTRIPNTDTISAISYPHRLNAGEEGSELFTASTIDRINTARQGRIERQLGHATLPRYQSSMQVFLDARYADNQLADLITYMPEELDTSGNNLRRQAQLACASFRAGLSVSANLSIGGFDTHGNHDDNHEPRMQQIVDGVDFLLQEADRQGIADQLYIIVGSDFARTPWYNDTNGKDHWSITSMMFIGPDIQGGRVIGGTNERQAPLSLDPNSLQPSESGNIIINPEHVHYALRELAGVNGTELEAQFSVGSQLLPLFG